MSDAPKSYRIKYEVHCKLQNFFGKEIIVKRCLSELHAKTKLDDFCKTKYGVDYQYIIVKSVSCEDSSVGDLFNDLFGNSSNSPFGKGFSADSFNDIIKDLKNKKK